MTKRNPPQAGATQPHDSAKRPLYSTGAVAIQSLASIFNNLVETVGVPGAVFLVLVWFVVNYATTEQKQRIIDMYVLGTGVGRVWPQLVLSAIFVLVAFAMRYRYGVKLATLDAELDRMGREKSKLQAKLAGRELQQTKVESRQEKGQ